MCTDHWPIIAVQFLDESSSLIMCKYRIKMCYYQTFLRELKPTSAKIVECLAKFRNS